MSYKIKSPYKDLNILSLNLMGVHEHKKSGISGVEFMFTLLPVIAIVALCVVNFMPELGFFAECQNIPGGDLCSISLK